MVAVRLRLRQLVFRFVPRLVVYRLPAVGLAAVSLRRMDLRTRFWLGLGADWFWLLERALPLAPRHGCLGPLRRHVGNCSRPYAGRARLNTPLSWPGPAAYLLPIIFHHHNPHTQH